MRINAHAHIFNLRAVFTEETLHILLNRLRLEKVPERAVEALQRKLADYLKKDIGAEAVFAALDQNDKITRELVELVKKLGAGGTGVDVKIGGVLAQLSSEAASYLRKLILEKYDLDENGEIKKTPLDTFEFLRIALLPSIEQVADEVMGQMKEEDILVALMMDITDGHDSGKQFAQQIRDTSDVVLAYPGRILPFVKVNKFRPGHVDIMKKALEEQGCWGVKLYPSLGYEVTLDALSEVCDYCQKHGVPLLTHCTDAGFRKSKDLGQLASPKPWRAILEEFPKLKICFGHFGGVENLIREDIPADSWTKMILDLMAEFEGVYADVSYHTDEMIGNDDLGIDQATAKKNYVKNLSTLLKSAPSCDRLLFGTDFWLVRQVTKDSDYWAFFTKICTPPQFKRLATDNPIEYLGLPGAKSPSRWLVEHHLAFFDSKKMQVAREPARWLADAAATFWGGAKKFIPVGSPTWTESNLVHKYLFQYLQKAQFRPADVAGAHSFAEYGRFKLPNLLYWDDRPEPAAFDTAVERFASDVIRLFRSPKLLGKRTACRDGVNEKIARQRLTAALRNESWYVYQLAGLCDSLFVFKS